MYSITWVSQLFRYNSTVCRFSVPHSFFCHSYLIYFLVYGSLFVVLFCFWRSAHECYVPRGLVGWEIYTDTYIAVCSPYDNYWSYLLSLRIFFIQDSTVSWYYLLQLRELRPAWCFFLFFCLYSHTFVLLLLFNKFTTTSSFFINFYKYSLNVYTFYRHKSLRGLWSDFLSALWCFLSDMCFSLLLFSALFLNLVSILAYISCSSFLVILITRQGTLPVPALWRRQLWGRDRVITQDNALQFFLKSSVSACMCVSAPGTTLLQLAMWTVQCQFRV